MITNDGKTYIKRYLATQVPSIALSIAFGVGSKAEAATDTYLQFEVGRSDIVVTSYDFVADQIIFKAPIDETYAGQITEVALFSEASNQEAGDYGSRLLLTFDSGTEEWVDESSGTDEAFTSNASRIGGDSLNQAPPASASHTSSLSGLFMDFSGNSGSDKFIFAFNNNNANAASITFKFMTDAANYFTFTVTSPATGYQIIEKLKSTATATGTPDWSDITEVQVTTTAGSGGAASVDFDGIRIEDVDYINPNYVMVSRKVLATAFTKTEGMVQDIEFALNVSL